VKKATKQSRETARRKTRQLVAFRRFRFMVAQAKPPRSARVLRHLLAKTVVRIEDFEQLSMRQKEFIVVNYGRI
jgi:hypothetical protein